MPSSDVAHESDRLSMLCLKMAVTPKICSEVMCIFSYKYLHIKFNRMGKTQTLTCYILPNFNSEYVSTSNYSHFETGTAVLSPTYCILPCSIKI